MSDDWKCPRCGGRGPHFVPPSLGQEGFYVCDEEPSPAETRRLRGEPAPELSEEAIPDAVEWVREILHGTLCEECGWIVGSWHEHRLKYPTHQGVGWNPRKPPPQWEDDLYCASAIHLYRRLAEHYAPQLEREAGERAVQALRDVLHQNVRGILLSTGIPVRERQYAIQTLVDVGAAFGILDVDEVGGAERFLKEGT